MLNSKENRESLKNLNQLISLKSQVEELRVQDKLGKKTFHEDMQRVFEPVTNSIKDVSQDVIRTITILSEQNNRALLNLGDKFLEKLKDRVLLACYLLFPLSKIIKPDYTSQLKIV